ncbi:MAG: recombinase family protein [Gemmatimonadota bacterium]|nr:recombinase family protein [Gemmatimonadota bacterium]
MSDVPVPTLQRVRELRAQGHSLRQIAAFLQAEGIPPPGRRRTWTHTAVRWCLSQRAASASPSSPDAQTLAAEVAQALDPKFAALLTKADQPPAWLLPPPQPLGWTREQWRAGLLGGLLGADAMIGFTLLLLWWVR